MRLSTESVKRAHLFVAIVCCALIAWLAHYSFATLQFTPDSWSLLELSKTISGDFYHILSPRQYLFPSEYGALFPPLTPTLIWAINDVFNLGITAGIYINIATMFALFFVLLRLSVVLTAEVFGGILLFFCLISSAAFIEEFQAARSIPLSLLLNSVVILNFVQIDRKLLPRVVSIGIAAGLAAINRFDCLGIGLALGVMVLIATRRWGAAAVYYAVFAIVVSPWVLYSLERHGRIWATEGGNWMWLATPIVFQDFIPTGTVLPTIKDNFSAWIAVTIPHLLEGAKNVVMLRYLALPAFFLFAAYKVSKLRLSEALAKCLRSQRLLLLVPVVAAHILAILLNAHYQPRYFLLELLVFGLILLTLASDLQTYSKKALPLWVKPALLLIAAVVAGGAYGHRLLVSDYAYQQTSIIRGAELSPKEARVVAHMDSAGVPDASLLVLGSEVYGARVSALTGKTMYFAPANAHVDGVLQEFIREKKVTFVYAEDPAVLAKIATHFPSKSLDTTLIQITHSNLPLHEISRRL